MSFRQKLQVELKHIEFSDSQKTRLKAGMRQARAAGRKRDLFERLTEFWNGYTEFSLPTLVGIIAFMAIVSGSVYARVFVVDETIAAILLKTTADMLETYAIDSGVIGF